MRLARLLFVLAFLSLPATTALAQSGKIAGVVTDAATGDPLPGVNVLIDGTTQGSVTDADGFYNILNVRPGTYTVRASFIGFTDAIREDVRVNINLTSTVDFQLAEEAVGMDEVVVQAERPIVQRDVSANVANISSEDVENLPITGVSEAINLQAGIEPGLTIRGGDLSEVAFIVDGMSTSGTRDQRPFTNVSYTAISEMQLQTGGFNAEYGNARSGIIQIATKEGPRDRYIADVMMRYSPPQKKYFGLRPDDPNSHYQRPFLDTTDSLAYLGTKTVWADDKYTRDQYGQFEGWIKQVEKNQTNSDPSDDHLTADDLMEIYRYRTRRSAEVVTPDYVVDGTIGGPVPGLNKLIGDLRFLGSFRQMQTAYVVPLERDAFTARTGNLKLTSNVRPGLKLVVHGMMAEELGMNTNNGGWPEMFNGEMPVYPWDNRGYLLAPRAGSCDVFAIGCRAMMDINRSLFGAEVTHTLGNNTFYEARIQRQYTDYFTRPGFRLDKDAMVHEVNGYQVNASPLGFDPEPGQQDAIGGRWLGVHTLSRDTSETTIWTAKFDITSQLNRYMQAKAGVEYVAHDYDISHGVVDSFHVHHANPYYVWARQPTQGAAYGQTKLEFKGMVANVGARLDYFHAAGDWYEYDSFDMALAAYGRENLDKELETAPTKRQFAISPRLGVAFPITVNSKFYFNYGHFRQVLDPRFLFEIEETFGGKVSRIGNPNHPMPRTVSYELGYEHNLFDRVLLRVAGYYKDISQQPRGVRYQNLDGQVEYTREEPLNYGDTRGFEVTLGKNRGKWIRGFFNYTYMVRKGGNFGFNRQYQNPVQQRNYERQVRNYQWRPTPLPFARFNIEFLVPDDFGPKVAGTSPLGDWRISFLGDWRAGEIFTYTGGGDVPGIRDNMQWKDYWNLDMRFSKNFGTTVGEAQLFVDVSNVLNIRRLSRWAAWGPNFNYERYMESLHLPSEVYEDQDGEIVAGTPAFIPGNDRPGDYREPGVEYVPIEMVTDLNAVSSPHQRPLYYHQDEAKYYRWNGSSWQPADGKFVDQVLEDKAYIVMPSVEWKRFFNPRHVLFGMRLSF